MELSRSITVNPSHHNVRVKHLAVWRDTKTEPSIGADIAAKVDGLLLEIVLPVEPEAFVEVGDVGVFLVKVLDSSRGHMHGSGNQK